MGLFDPQSEADILELVRAHPLATLVSQSETGFAATPLPLVARADGDGPVTTLIGHFASSNPQIAALRADPRALAVFHGPQAYVPPRLVSKPDWGPTWNYAVVRFQVRVTLTPELNHEALDLLIGAVEGCGPDAWRAERMGGRYDQLIRRIVAFRADVLAVQASFKLGQDEDETSFAEIVAGIGNRELASLMARQRKK